MKAAILHQLGTDPVYGDFPDPVPADDSQVLMTVKASAIKQLDKLKASGKHYTSYPQFPTTIGVDGTGVLEDGTRVYAMGLSGMFAEKALIARDSWVPLPDALDFETAAVLPNALLGSDAALVYRAKITEGQVVLINGATGVSGKMAVQAARYRGASRVIVTGRNPEILEELKLLGADDTISLKQEDQTVINYLKTVHGQTPIDIVLDYLWGHPMELILSALKDLPPHTVKIVTIGEMAGPTITLPSGILRSTRIELFGSGIGSISRDEIAAYMKNTLPQLFELAATGNMKTGIETGDLQDIESLWTQEATPGKRMVVRI
jgi:NADPH:quinone reductase-like Zn-dependent oxidoreductase